jgi:hypothetical protein
VNAAQVHLMFNHWPLILITVGFFILLIGEMKLNTSYKQLGLTIFVIAALLAIPSQFSGEGAEHILEDIGALDAATHTQVEKHATLGFFSAMLAYALGILSFISLIVLHSSHAFFSYIRKLIIVGAAAGIVLMALTAHSGGEIRHPEIRMNMDAGMDHDDDYDDDYDD